MRKRLRIKAWRSFADCSGFTIMEGLVATGLTAVMMTALLGSVLTIRGGYVNDVVRTRIHGNLRSAMDIISMNVRQSGEHLQSSFPAVTVTDGGTGQPDILKLRRGLISEVLTLCADAVTGNTTIFVSANALTNSACVTNNVTSVYNAFANRRAADDDSNIRIYIWDRNAKVGEFLDYSAEGLSGGQYYLTTTALTNDYAQLNTSIFVVEELEFQLDTATDTLNVYVDGDMDAPRAVAFSITAFTITALMSDSTTLNAIDENSTQDWKDVKQLNITLSGRETYKQDVITDSVTASYFPRNVLSHD